MPNNGRTEQDNRYQVQSVARAASLLNVIADEGATGLSVTEIALRLSVAKSTALALARTLASAGLLRGVEPGPRYVLGLNLLRLGDLVGQQTSIAELGLPTLRDLSATTGMTAMATPTIMRGTSMRNRVIVLLSSGLGNCSPPSTATVRGGTGTILWATVGGPVKGEGPRTQAGSVRSEAAL